VFGTQIAPARFNAAHGLRRNNADKRRAVEVLLRDEEWGKWSNSEIARRCSVSDEFVRQERSHLQPLEVSERQYTTKHGTTATMDTRKIREASKKRAATLKAQKQARPNYQNLWTQLHGRGGAAIWRFRQGQSPTM
jgi:hypothetical protein